MTSDTIKMKRKLEALPPVVPPAQPQQTQQIPSAQPQSPTPAVQQLSKSPLEISAENYENMSINKPSAQVADQGPRYMTREEGRAAGIGWQGRMAKYKEDLGAASELAKVREQNKGNIEYGNLNAAAGLAKENLSQHGATQRQQMGDTAQTNMTNIRETAQTGRQKAGDAEAMARLAAGHGFTIEQMTKKDQFDVAGDHRKTAADALLAGTPGEQVTQAMNVQPGFNVDYKGIQVPLKNNQTDQYQAIARDNQSGGQSVVILNRQTGQLHEDPAISALTTGQQAQQQTPAARPTDRASAIQAQASAPGATPAAPDAFSKVYQSNPKRLQEDTEFAASQIGTVYKTDEEQLSYLNSVRKTNPTLFQALKLRLGQQQPAAR